MRARALARLALAVSPMLVSSCTVQQAVQSRKHRVEATKGAEVSGGAFERPIRYVGRIRVYASEAYNAQRGGWKTRLREMVDSAGTVLGPAFGLRLEVVDTRLWDSDCDPASLQDCLAELARHDPGDDVDWVVGLVSAVPRFTTSFDELGMAEVPGRYFVLRDLYAPGEREAITAMFPAMSASKRTDIYNEQQQHKRLVIFLHEWAHTMGALHTRRDDTILYPRYDRKVAGFSEENMRLIDASLKDRFPFDPSYSKLREFLAANDSEVWLPGERDALLRALPSVGARGPTALGSAPAQTVLSGDEDELLGGVSPGDRLRYEKAETQLEAQDLEASWKTLEPLLDRYPDCYAIQHFGCSLAMRIGARQQTGKACRRTISLAGSQ